MQPNDWVTVSIDLARVRQNTEAIRRLTGVPIIAVVKCDAYGLGAAEVAGAIGDLVEAFYVFDAAEAVHGRLWDIAGKRTIALHGAWDDPQEYLSRHIQPVVWSEERATQLKRARPVLSIDTGQQRFACPGQEVEAVKIAGDCHEVMTHAVTMAQVHLFREKILQWSIFAHAAGSGLLGQQHAWLDAVRPGMALYRGAVGVTARLMEVRDSAGPAGYTGFIAKRFGVIRAGYAAGLRPGPCSVNGQIRQILEVGMQSAFIAIGPTDQRGDDVVLLDELTGPDEATLAEAWLTSPQEVLVRMIKMTTRKY